MTSGNYEAAVLFRAEGNAVFGSWCPNKYFGKKRKKNGQNLQFWIPKNFEECVLFVKKTLTNVLNAMKLDDLKQMFFLNISKKARKTIHLLHKEQDKSSLFGQRQIGTTSKSVF